MNALGKVYVKLLRHKVCLMVRISINLVQENESWGRQMLLHDVINHHNQRQPNLLKDLLLRWHQ